MNKTKHGTVVAMVMIVGVWLALAVNPAKCFSSEQTQLSEKTLENAWSNLNLDAIDFKKAGVSEQEMRETLARVCAEFSADPQKSRFLIKEIHKYEEFRTLYMSSSESVRKRVDMMLPQVLANIFTGKNSLIKDIPLTDLTKGLATYLANKKKMDAFAKLRYNENMMRRFAASIYTSLDTDNPKLARSLETLFVTVANKKKYKFDKKTARDHTLHSGPLLADLNLQSAMSRQK